MSISDHIQSIKEVADAAQAKGEALLLRSTELDDAFEFSESLALAREGDGLLFLARELRALLSKVEAPHE